MFGRFGRWIESGTLAFDAAAYSANDVLPDGYITLTCSVREEGE